MYKLTVFIPDSDLETVKSALFAAGAGQIGNYSNCCWQVQGTGQFMPLDGSQPHIGSHNSIEQVTEWRVEMVVAKNNIHAVIDTLKQAHPYETPAYDVIAMVDI
ncbi:YqfO family protein [Psychrobacter sp. FDAARGOS_221]|uniref:Nif3-like dinuclear metal center hexameric protein n=1 Tax=Psychrobacter sp. FDAARGOS_221 TaxID=1975705 RepID=UPI000BB58487|nr:YqfO family protein [Psychrobacter sp. FDAARGOS_221]PNK61032.1 NGG1p interacting factor NIF3 [Psychrobacter sp. FDAARGOS_221]